MGQWVTETTVAWLCFSVRGRSYPVQFSFGRCGPSQRHLALTSIQWFSCIGHSSIRWFNIIGLSSQVLWDPQVGRGPTWTNTINILKPAHNISRHIETSFNFKPFNPTNHATAFNVLVDKTNTILAWLH